MSERNALDAKICINDEVAWEDFGGHDLADFGVDDLLPRVSRVRHHEPKIEAKLLDHLPLHWHDLSDWKLMHQLFRVEHHLSPNRSACEHRGWKLHFLLLIWGQVPVWTFPEHCALLSILHSYRLDSKLALRNIIQLGRIDLLLLLNFVFFHTATRFRRHILAIAYDILHGRTFHCFTKLINKNFI